jgi:hypothetical protein
MENFGNFTMYAKDSEAVGAVCLIKGMFLKLLSVECFIDNLSLILPLIFVVCKICSYGVDWCLFFLLEFLSMCLFYHSFLMNCELSMSQALSGSVVAVI